MVGGHHVGTEPLCQVKRDAFGKSPGVHEHQRRPMLGDECRDAVVDLSPQLFRRNRPELASWRLDREIELSPRIN